MQAPDAATGPAGEAGTGLTYRLGHEATWLPQLVALYRAAGLGEKAPEALNAAFQASHRVATAWGPEGQLLGAGRLLSDGVYYACVFDVAVAPEWQGRGVGQGLMALLEAEVPGLRLHLTATFGKEGFYRRLGYRRHRTALAKYPGAEASPYLAPWPEGADEAQPQAGGA